MGIFVSAIQKRFTLKMMENLTFKIHDSYWLCCQNLRLKPKIHLLS